jgi:hypothetical protein
MRHQVTIVLPGGEEVALRVADALTVEAARVWLDQEFTRLNCEPARPTGKVLLADKLLAIAEASGAEGFADAAWAASYARAAAGALDRPLIRVDVEAATIGS